jgi:FtsP/CotA-like multicopper oxidase with cupredoxin domain
VGPTPVTGRDLRLAGGGRYDVVLETPPGPVTVHGLGGGHRLVLGEGPPARSGDQPLLDLATYGSAADTPFDADSAFDRDFVLDIDRRMRFQDGRLGWQWTVNGESYPRMPMLVVREGDLVRTTIVNRSTATHPMHLHGHHVLVLERNGQPVSGSPWWSDTLDVAPGERYVVAFRADNPGIWMDHCHDLGHAADGFVLHLAYDGVRTPFSLGGAAGNTPE